MPAAPRPRARPDARQRLRIAYRIVRPSKPPAPISSTAAANGQAMARDRGNRGVARRRETRLAKGEILRMFRALAAGDPMGRRSRGGCLAQLVEQLTLN